MKNILNDLLIIMLAFISLLSLCSFNVIFKNYNHLVSFFRGNNFLFLNYAIIYFFILKFFKDISKNEKYKDKRLNILSLILGNILSLITLLGFSFMAYKNTGIIYDNKFQMRYFFLLVIGFTSLYYFILKYIIKKVAEYINNNKNNNILKKTNLIKKHPIIFTSLLLFIFYLPYIIFYFPGTLNADSMYEIEQFFGSFTWTQHHPVFPTLLYGLFMKLGVYYKLPNLGLFLPNILQMIISIIIVSYCIYTVDKYAKSDKLKIILILFFILFPLFPINFYTEVKDSFFAIFFLLYIIQNIKFYNNDISKKDFILYFISILFIYLFRNNGLHVLVLSLPFIIFSFEKKIRKKVLLISFISIISGIVITKSIVSIYDISPGSKGEMLSFPLSQTARYIKQYELTKEEENAINKIVLVENFKKNYNPETIDFIKKDFNESATNEDLKNYFIVWFKMFLKHPNVYLDATINTTFGYFYPNRYEYKDDVAELSINCWDVLDKDNLKLGFPKKTTKNRLKFNNYIHKMRLIPVINLLFNCGTYSWILFIISFILIYIKKYKKLLILVPLYVTLLVCLLSPINALIRYVEPLIISMPFIICFIIQNEEFKKNTR